MDAAIGQSGFADALLGGAALPANVTSLRGVADPARFAVYRNNVFVGLTSALAKRFPVTQRLVGEDFFAGMARIYAGQTLPRTPLMFEYGDGFPDFIAGFGPAGGVPYLADIARLEAAWSRAYHAADMPVLTPADLAALPPAALAQTRLDPHPAAALIVSHYAVGSIWQAHQQAEFTAPPIGGAEAVLITRPDMHVRVAILPAEDIAFAAALLDGAPLGTAAEQVAASAPFDVGTALVGLVSLGAFAGTPIPQETSA